MTATLAELIECTERLLGDYYDRIKSICQELDQPGLSPHQALVLMRMPALPTPVTVIGTTCFTGTNGSYNLSKLRRLGLVQMSRFPNDERIRMVAPSVAGIALRNRISIRLANAEPADDAVDAAVAAIRRLRGARERRRVAA